MDIKKIGEHAHISISRDGIKQHYYGDLMLQTDKTAKTLVNTKEMKVIARKPLKQDMFQKEQPVDLEGKIVNKNGVINN